MYPSRREGKAKHAKFSLILQAINHHGGHFIGKGQLFDPVPFF